MCAPPSPRPKPNRARIATWARLWLACIAALLNCAEHLLSPALRRRLPLLDLPPRVLARYVARLIFLCAINHATPPARDRTQTRERHASALRALLRAGTQRHLINSDGDVDLAHIARTCANPDAAIANMIAALERGFNAQPRSCADIRAESHAHQRAVHRRARLRHVLSDLTQTIWNLSTPNHPIPAAPAHANVRCAVR